MSEALLRKYLAFIAMGFLLEKQFDLEAQGVFDEGTLERIYRFAQGIPDADDAVVARALETGKAMLREMADDLLAERRDE